MDEVLIIMKSFVDEWKSINTYDRTCINRYIEKYEGLLVGSGAFVKGIRIKPVNSEQLSTMRHYTLDGVLGILSMNVELIKNKLNVLS